VAISEAVFESLSGPALALALFARRSNASRSTGRQSAEIEAQLRGGSASGLRQANQPAEPDFRDLD